MAKEDKQENMKMDAGQSVEDIRDILNKKKKHRIMIPSTEKEKDAIQVGINGYVYNIPRDKEVEVPDAVIEVLSNASYTMYEVVKREEGEGNELIGKDVRRIPYQTVR